MPSSTRNVQLGICKVVYDGKDLGYTKGGVEVSVSTETYKVEIDQFGKTAINELIQGRNVQVTCPLAETTLENLVEIMPGATYVGDGVQATGTLTSAGTQPTATTGTVTIAGVIFTFVTATPTGPTQVKIGTSAAASMANLAFAINNYDWSKTSTVFLAGGIRASLNSTGLIMTLRALDRGTLGNAITTVAAAPSNITASGATLTTGANTTRARVDVVVGTDVDMLAIAKVLRLHPVKKADNDFSDDFILYSAAPAGSLQFAYQVDSERLFNVTFTGYPDPSSATGRIFSIGDPHYQP